MIVTCPQCGAPVEFRYDDSFVRVCGNCRAAVVRSDRGIETLGRVADLTPQPTSFALFTEGRWRNVGFQLIGRAQLRHAAGGLWQEWYGKFDDGRWGWIAEAQGRIYLTFEVSGAGAPPPWDQLAPGQRIQLEHDGARSFVVAERGEATYEAADGEIPYRFAPGLRYAFADLADDSGRFATLDYADDRATPSIYLGYQVSLDQLGVTAVAEAAPSLAAPAQGRHLACPQCGGSIELRAPDASLRVACPFCDALLDVRAGDLSLLRRLGDHRGKSAIPLGTSARFEDRDLIVIGYLRRLAIIGGQRWPFEEYLLHHPQLGFRWLVDSDGHWSYVRPVAVGAVHEDGSGGATYDGTAFRHFQGSQVVVDAVLGEMYWKVEVDEQVHAVDFIAPPAMLSKEESGQEITWSLGEYLTPDDVKARLRLAELPHTASGVAPNQPYRHAGAGRTFAFLALAAIGIAAIIGILSDDRVVLRQQVALTDVAPPVEQAAPDAAQGQVAFSEPFELAGHQNVAIELSAPVDNSWVYVVGDLVDEASGELESFDKPIEYYSGYDGGESWTEGSRTAIVHLGAAPPGRYVLRLEVQRDPALRYAGSLDVVVRQDVFRLAHLGYALLAVAVPGLFFLFGRLWFERRRWRDSIDPPWYARAGESDDD